MQDVKLQRLHAVQFESDFCISLSIRSNCAVGIASGGQVYGILHTKILQMAASFNVYPYDSHRIPGPYRVMI
eukprot:588862-Pleurochrysis_carterae.AAC.1